MFLRQHKTEKKVVQPRLTLGRISLLYGVPQQAKLGLSLIGMKYYVLLVFGLELGMILMFTDTESDSPNPTPSYFLHL